MMRLLTRRKIAAYASVGVLAISGAVAYAYYSASGSGTGSGAAGSASATTVNEAAPINGDYSTGDGSLYPGTTQTVHLTVTNNGKGNQWVGQVTLSGWTSDKPGCDSATHPTDFTMPAVNILEDVGPSLTSASHDGTITFVDNSAASQNYCQGASITWDFTAS